MYISALIKQATFYTTSENLFDNSSRNIDTGLFQREVNRSMKNFLFPISAKTDKIGLFCQ